jgi:hypothetical protein
MPPRHKYGEIEPFRGYKLAPKYTAEGRLVLYDVWRPNKIERDDEPAATFWGPDARDRAKRWIVTEEAKEKYPRISMRRVSRGR